MTGENLLERLLNSFAGDYDLERNTTVGTIVYDAHAYLNVRNARYVLVKKAELWRADCYEHVYFRCVDAWEPGMLSELKEQIQTILEPDMVRKGEKYPPKDHMYTFITVIYIANKGVSRDCEKEIRSFRYHKDYLFSFRGYCQARVLVFDLENERILGNRAAGELVRGYTKQEGMWR